MKIIGFAQLRNESSNGNLENFFRSMSVCDALYIYDQGSDDDSFSEYLRLSEKYGLRIGIKYNNKNEFYNEIACKEKLLQRVIELEPDVDWILWMDGDTILDGRLQDRNVLERVCGDLYENGEDCGILGHFNLWRSDLYYRTDNKYHWLNDHGVGALWRNTGKLTFGTGKGLHVRNKPMGCENERRIPYYLIHRGFATDSSLLRRYEQRFPYYIANGKSPWILNRTIDETGLTFDKVPTLCLPEWYQEIANEATPEDRELLIEVPQFRKRVEDVMEMTWEESQQWRPQWML